LERASAREPEYAASHYFRGWVLRSVGDVPGALAALRHSLSLDPYSPGVLHALAYTLFCAGEVAAAIELERHAPPETSVGGLIQLTIFAAWRGSQEEAVALGRQAVERSAGDANAVAALSYAEAAMGNPDEARELAARALDDKLIHATRTFLAATFTALGDLPEARRMLDEARRDRCPYLASAGLDPRLAELFRAPGRKAGRRVAARTRRAAS